MSNARRRAGRIADANQIEQIILNLCSNAWHALQGERRGGVIDIQLGAQVRDGRRFASLTVRDNGMAWMKRRAFGSLNRFSRPRT